MRQVVDADALDSGAEGANDAAHDPGVQVTVDIRRVRVDHPLNAADGAGLTGAGGR